MITSMQKPSVISTETPLIPPPLPIIKGWPLLGALPALLKDPFGFLTRAREKQGDIYTLNLGFIKLVILNHPRHAQQVLRDNAQNYYKGGAIWQAVRGLTGNGLILSEGDFWLRQRRLMQPQFHRQRLAALTSLMVEAIDQALKTWEPITQQAKPFDLLPAFNQLTMCVVAKTLFGTALTAAELTEVSEIMPFAINYVMVDAATKALPAWLPIPGKRRYQQVLARFDEIIYRIIADGRRSAGKENHLLAMLLDAVDEETGVGMDDRQLRDEVATLFLAGYETTAAALAWAFHYLTSHPETMQKLQAEVDSVLDGRQPTFADLPNLAYARMVFQEVLRLRPVSFWTPRTAMHDDTIDGYPIPAGTHVASFTYMYHHHPAIWSEPTHFDPGRFTPERSAGRHPFAWIPFSAGQRLCIGRDFSLMEGQLALAMVVQRYQLAPVAGHTPKLRLGATLRPVGGVQVKVVQRT